MNISSVSNAEDSKSRVGLNAGIFMNAPIAENFSIQPELLYNSKGVKWEGSEDGSTVGDYLSVPVCFSTTQRLSFI
nr:outer membrane beta-barrel protein [Kaistella montana]